MIEKIKTFVFIQSLFHFSLTDHISYFQLGHASRSEMKINKQRGNKRTKKKYGVSWDITLIVLSCEQKIIPYVPQSPKGGELLVSSNFRGNKLIFPFIMFHSVLFFFISYFSFIFFSSSLPPFSLSFFFFLLIFKLCSNSTIIPNK